METPQSVLRTASSAQGTPCGCPFRGAYTPKGSLVEKASLEKGGGPAKLVEGFFCKIFCIMFQVIRKNPSVSLRLPAPFSREPKVKASLEKGGEPPLGGGGIFCEIFYMMFQITLKNRRDYPTSAFQSTLQRGAALC